MSLTCYNEFNLLQYTDIDVIYQCLFRALHRKEEGNGYNHLKDTAGKAL